MARELSELARDLQAERDTQAVLQRIVAATLSEIPSAVAAAIGQAKGILMERFRLNADEAFQLLVAVSQHQHRKLRDVADDLASSGEMPDLV